LRGGNKNIWVQDRLKTWRTEKTLDCELPKGRKSKRKPDPEKERTTQGAAKSNGSNRGEGAGGKTRAR